MVIMNEGGKDEKVLNIMPKLKGVISFISTMDGQLVGGNLAMDLKVRRADVSLCSYNSNVIYGEVEALLVTLLWVHLGFQNPSSNPGCLSVIFKNLGPPLKMSPTISE
jgi:hypothetical protein